MRRCAAAWTCTDDTPCTAAYISIMLTIPANRPSIAEKNMPSHTCIGGTPHRKGVNVEIDCVAMFDQ